MPKSKSKPTVRVASSGALPRHPGMAKPNQLLLARMGAQPEPLRLPDAYAQPTAATILKDEYTVSSDANGNFVFGENFNLAFARLPYTVDLAGALTAGAAIAHPRGPTFYSESRVARCVLVKVSVTWVGREDTTSGFLSYDSFNNASELVGANIGSLHTDSLVQVDANKGLEVHVTFTQEPRWETANTGTFMSATFPVTVFVASGLPVSVPVYRVRVWRYMEYLPANGTVSEGNMEYEPYDPNAMAVHSQLGHVNASVRTVGGRNALKEMANAALHIAAPVGKWIVDEAKEAFKAQAVRSFASYGGAMLMAA